MIRERPKTFGEIWGRALTHITAEEIVTMKHGNAGAGSSSLAREVVPNP